MLKIYFRNKLTKVSNVSDRQEYNGQTNIGVPWYSNIAIL